MPDNNQILDEPTSQKITLTGRKIIEASAGTGKTYTLANLYLRYILDNYRVDCILVVTFTNAATEELRGRIRERLNQAFNYLSGDLSISDPYLSALLKNSDDAHIELCRLKLQLAIRSMDDAAVYTIHGFCQRILTEQALLTGQSFSVSLSGNDNELWERALLDWWRQKTYLLDSASWQLVERSTGGIKTLMTRLQQIRKKPNVQIIPHTDQSFDDLLSQQSEILISFKTLALSWAKYRVEVVQQITDSKKLSRKQSNPYKKDNLDNFFSEIDQFFSYPVLANFEKGPGFLARSILTDELMPKAKGEDPTLSSEFFDETDRLKQTIGTLFISLNYRALIESNRFINDSLNHIKNRSGQLAFHDLLVRLDQALQGDSGAKLAELLRKKFPVALIDEFQDTDALQYRIFSTIYPVNRDTSLILIGDPKQAIYSFRGGDIYSYIDARSALDLDRFSLATNWRSSHELVSAVNTLFLRNQFAFQAGETEDSIQFEPVGASHNPTQGLEINGQLQKAITIWPIPLDDKGKGISQRLALTEVSQWVAAEISVLLDKENNRVNVNKEPVQAGDIAVLVRKSAEATILQDTLSENGIASVIKSRVSVFESDEATGLYHLLEAIQQYFSALMARKGLTSSLLNHDTAQIQSILNDDHCWQHWLDQLKSLNQIWSQRGFIQMFQQAQNILSPMMRIAEADHCERRLTNYLHLGEILQKQSRLTSSIDHLMVWFKKQIDSNEEEETRLRLESDSDLVVISTIHNSKGLEYPIVFLPYPWSSSGGRKDSSRIVFCHDQNHQLVADIGSSELDEHSFRERLESMSEDMRILYVALTRARSKLYLSWGNVRNQGLSSSDAALSRLIHPTTTGYDQINRVIIKFESDFDVLPDLVSLQGSDIEIIQPRSISTIEPSATTKNQHTQITLDRVQKMSLINWRIASFSSLTRNIHQRPHGGQIEPGGDPILDFVAGSRVGLFLHELLENIDFTVDLKSQCKIWLPVLAPAYGFIVDQISTLVLQWLIEIVGCPLDDNGLSLKHLSPDSRLNELPFDFAFNELRFSQLNELCSRLKKTQPEPIELDNFKGLISGVIDLVFVNNGRYYLADYKSNFLGSRLQDYTEDKLEQAIVDRRYDLQSLIYSLAVHRYLATRITDYDYDTHFGGSYYLFLRAMRINSGNSYGVYIDRPEKTVIHELDRIFGHDGVFV